MTETTTSPTTTTITTTVLPPEPPRRLVSLDAYRGLAMLLMASEGLNLAGAARRAEFQSSRLWQFLGHQTDHVAWTGCALWDLIQPSFMFMVGVSLPFSIAARRAKGQTFAYLFAHALWRSFLLIFLGIFLRSLGRPMLNFTFEDVLTQIGLGYPILFLLAFTRPRTQLIVALLILAGYWAMFAAYPLPPSDFDYASVGVSPDFPHPHGFAAHWDKNTNIAHHFDAWFLNLFPRQKVFTYNGGGYLTLSFIPSLATMIFGLLAGGLLKREDVPPARKVGILVLASAIGFVSGLLLDRLNICPIVKRIWTPSWTLFAAGWTFLILAVFYDVIDRSDRRRWAFPLVVVGMNSITMYVLAHVANGFIWSGTRTVWGTVSRWLSRIFAGRSVDFLDAAYVPILEAAVVLTVLWLFLLWMYRRRIFLRI
jgi:predicted acyltransferase